MEWSIGVEIWSQILECQNFLLHLPRSKTPLHRRHGFMYSMEWSLGAEYCSGVESNFGKSSCSLLIKWRAVVINVCVAVLVITSLLIYLVSIKMDETPFFSAE